MSLQRTSRSVIADVQETKIGFLPKDWEIVEADELGQIITGTTPRTKVPEYYEGPFPFVSPGDIGANRVVQRTQKHLSEKGLTVSRPLPSNTILVVCIGATIGKVAMSSQDNTTTNQQINALIPNDDVCPDYLYYAFKHRSSDLPSLAGRAAVPIVNKSNFARFPIPLPPLPEQEAIAHVLRIVQEAKEGTEKVIEATRELKRSLMNHLFTYGPVPVDEADQVPLKETEIGPMPERWQMCILDDLKVSEKGAIVTGPFGSNIGKRFFVDQGVPVIRGNNLTKGIVRFKDEGFVFITEDKAQELAKYTALPGDLLFTAAGTIGQVGVIPQDRLFKKYIISNKQLRARIDVDSALPDYLYYWFASYRMQSVIAGRRRGTSIPVINLGILRSLPVGLPDLVTQEQIVRILSTLDRKLEAEENRQRSLEVLFKTLLHNLMTGKVSVTDPGLSKAGELV